MQKLVLTEEQQMLKDAAQGLFSDQAPVSQLRKLRDDKDPLGYRPEFWNQAVELGLAGTLIPENHGGSEFGHVGMGQVMEEGGRTLAASPLFASGVLGACALMLAGNDRQKETLKGIAAGSHLMALAIDETGRHQPSLVTTRAEAQGSGFVLNGSKTFVVDGHIANTLIVSARTSGGDRDQQGITLFLVDPTAEGVNVQRTIFPDGRNYAKVQLQNVALGEDAILGGKDDGFGPLQTLLDIGNAHLAAELLGLSSEAFDRTVAYMKERKQFGVYISSFQALQHRAAHMWGELEQVKSMVLKALMALDANDDQASVLVSAAKAKASQVAELVTNEGVQLHGGMGMTDEFDVGLFMKRARPVQLLLGDYRFHADRVATLKGF